MSAFAFTDVCTLARLPRVGFHDLRRLLLDDERACNQVFEESSDFSEKFRQKVGQTLLVHIELFTILGDHLYLLAGIPQDVGEVFTPALNDVKIVGV
jgi:hypothetical protein